MKFAVVMSSNWAYRYGLNGFLNGLDYHNNTVSDVYVLDISQSGDIPQWYWEKANEVFDFGVHVRYLDDYMKMNPNRPEHGNRIWCIFHYKYLVARDIAPDYDAIMVSDNDYLVCGNLDNYVKAVLGTDLILVPNLGDKPLRWHMHINNALNEDLREMLEQDKHFVSTANSPFIVDCKENFALYDKTFDCGFDTGNDMWSLFQAIVALDKSSDVIALPGALWYNPLWREVPIYACTVSGKRCYFTHGEKMMMIHRRWWAHTEQHKWAKNQPPQNQALCHENVHILLKECELINTTWKLPLEWNLSRWSSEEDDEGF